MITPFERETDPFAQIRIVSIIPRWSVMPVIRRQTNGEHIFLVARYAEMIMKNHDIKEVLLSDVLSYALRHDDAEAINGDIPSPAPANQLKDRSDENLFDPLVVAIVKTADKLEAVYYLKEEERLGNTFASEQLPQCIEKMENTYEKLIHMMLDRRKLP